MTLATASTTKDHLRAAALRLVADGGPEAASVRAITQEAGVTGAALYRHYETKEDLWRDVYACIVTEMMLEKSKLIELESPVKERIKSWVQLTYAYYDGNRDAFNYVLLTTRSVAETCGDLYTAQGRLFMELIRQGQESGELSDTAPELGLALFSGMLLSVPRLINEGTLQTPAAQYVDDVAEAAWVALRNKEPPSAL